MSKSGNIGLRCAGIAGTEKKLMAENLPIMVSDESQDVDSYGSSREIIGLELDIFGQPVNLRIGVTDGYARLADIVPLARKLSRKNNSCSTGETPQRGKIYSLLQRLLCVLQLPDSPVGSGGFLPEA